MRQKSQALMAFLVGLIFALGLGISGMTQPQKVIHFLQFGEGWDPSLMFVMLAAIPVHFLAYRWVAGRKNPLLDHRFHLPQTTQITKPLAIGSVLFGLGWGLGGYCPGPALTSLVSGQLAPVVFVVSMLVGMRLYRLYEKQRG